MLLLDSNPVIQDDIISIASCGLDWTFLANKTILVAGGSGLLGAYLVKSFLAINEIYCLNLRVICVTRKPQSVQKRLSDSLENSCLTIIIHDISEPLPIELPPADIVIHAASQASPRYYGIDPVGTLLANTAGTLNMLRYSVKSQCARFLFFSSGEVYGIPLDPLNITEHDYGYLDPTQIRSCYAESKRMGETMCAAWSHQFGIHSTILRPFHTYGPGMALDDGRVFADFVADVVRGQDIVLKSDGLAMRPFCYISDATMGFLTALLKGSSGEAYNVAFPSTEITMRDLAYTLAGLFPGRGIGVRFELAASDNSYLKSPIFQSCPSIAKISGLGWQPEIGIEDGFRRTINSYL
jgi:nucleoside-diphosphate-sugar epimerase